MPKAELITVNSNGIAYYKVDLFIDVWISGDCEKVINMFISVDDGRWVKLQKYPLNKRINIPRTFAIKNDFDFSMKIKIKAVLIDLDGKELLLVRDFSLRGYLPSLIK